ncbi:MAG TPA: uroporphyrinogen decarboxylase family protein [Spirochaetota bacterium]|nr:uroporphyrinogen decarboxylase family protein [Spirochaetota bacterium]
MTGIQRIMAALRGESADRRAVIPVLSLYGARLTDCSPKEYYTSGEAYARGQDAVCERFDPDAVIGPFCFAFHGAAWGARLHWFDDQAPSIMNPATRVPDELFALTTPDTDTNPWLLPLRIAVRSLARKHGSSRSIAMPLPAAVDLPSLIMGIEPWLETILFEPELADRIMQMIVPFFRRLASAFHSDGAGMIVMPCGFASPSMVTREIVTRFSRPWLETSLRDLPIPVIFHHGGAPCNQHLDLLSGLPGVPAILIDERDDPLCARSMTGTTVILGGPQGPAFHQRPAESIRRICSGILEKMRTDRHFILATSGPDIPWDTPPDRIDALFEAAHSEASPQ